MTAALHLARRPHFDAKVNAKVHPVMPGDHLVIDMPGTAVSTLLGSCVAACIRCRNSGRGGLNHFLLPGSDNSHSSRYGAYAMEVLINEILSDGCTRDDLEAKVFGGGEVLANSQQGPSVGQMNAIFVRGYLRNENIAVTAEDLGGSVARRVYYFPDTGKVRVQYLAPIETSMALERVARYRRSLAEKLKSGSVELF